MSSFLHNLKDFQFMIKEEETNQKINTINKLESVFCKNSNLISDQNSHQIDSHCRSTAATWSLFPINNNKGEYIDHLAGSDTLLPCSTSAALHTELNH